MPYSHNLTNARQGIERLVNKSITASFCSNHLAGKLVTACSAAHSLDEALPRAACASCVSVSSRLDMTGGATHTLGHSATAFNVHDAGHSTSAAQRARAMEVEHPGHHGCQSRSAALQHVRCSARIVLKLCTCSFSLCKCVADRQGRPCTSVRQAFFSTRSLSPARGTASHRPFAHGDEAEMLCFIDRRCLVRCWLLVLGDLTAASLANCPQLPIAPVHVTHELHLSEHGSRRQRLRVVLCPKSKVSSSLSVHRCPW